MRGCRSGTREPVSQAWCRSGMVVLAVSVGALLCLVTAGGTKAGEGRARVRPRPCVRRRFSWKPRRLRHDPRSIERATPYVLAAGRVHSSWSPDGRRIVYRVNPPRSDEGDVWVMRADGSRKTNLTRSPAVADWSPSWSPDGSRIAYFSTAGGEATSGRCVRMGAASATSRETVRSTNTRRGRRRSEPRVQLASRRPVRDLRQRLGRLRSAQPDA